MIVLSMRRLFRSPIYFAIGLLVAVVGVSWSAPTVAQQYLTPAGTDPVLNDANANAVKVAPPLNNASTIQRKAGSLLIGPDGGTAKLCLNSASTADLAKCIQGWADLSNSIGGPFLKFDRALYFATPGDGLLPAGYVPQPGFVRVQAHCVGGVCSDNNRQLYSFLTKAPILSGTDTIGLYATDSGDAASYAGYFSGRLHIYRTIGGVDGQLCLNGTGSNCIDQWTDISPPSTLFLTLQGPNTTPTPDIGSVSLSGTGLFGSAVIDVPLASTSRTSTCGDGFCRVQTTTDPTNYETSANCPIDCATIVQPPVSGGLTVLNGAELNIGGQYCSLNSLVSCTSTPDTCGANGTCVTMTNEIRVSTPSTQLPLAPPTQIQVIVIRSTSATPTFVPLQGSTYTTGSVFGDSTIIYSGKHNQGLVNSLISHDAVPAAGTYTYRAYMGNIYPRYGVVYVPAAVSNQSVTYKRLTVNRVTPAGGVPSSTENTPFGQIRCHDGTTPNLFCVGYYRAGALVTIDGQPNSGYTTAWAGCTDDVGDTCSVTLNTDMTITATYSLIPVTQSLTVGIFGTGTVTGTYINCPGDCSETFTGSLTDLLTATAGTDYSFSGWTGCSSIQGGKCRIDNITSSTTITATFTCVTNCGGGGGPPSGGCFVAGTPVDTPHGPRAIDKLKVGDEVMAYDETTGQTVVSRVTNTFIHVNEPYGRLTLSNGTTLQVTSIHRFYDPRSRTWRKIGDMQPGDVVLYGYGATAKFVTILASEFSSGRGTVYNLEIERYHNYYVNGILVHNRKL